MLYLIGLGLADEKDITVKGLEAIKSCCRVYLEAYTSILMEKFYGCSVIIADREFVEQNSDEMLKDADTKNVAFLVVGDPYGATTHTDLVTRAKALNIKTKTIHNASIMNAIGSTGLSLYAFGQTVSIPFHTDTWKPTSFMEKIKVNQDHEFHTLLLLDIKVKEQSIENMARGRLVYEPARFMKVNECIEQLLYCELVDNQNGLARVGADDQLIISGTVGELLELDFGLPLHSFIIPGKMHFMEFEALEAFAFDKATFKQHARVFDH